jgi:acyl carrier protein
MPLPAAARLVRETDITRDDLLECDPLRQREQIAEFVRNVAARALAIAPERIDMGKPLTDAGLDSAVTAEIRTVIERRLRIRIPMAQLMKGPTGDEFAAMILELFTATCAQT